MEDMFNRRITSKFKTKDIEQRKIDKLLRAAMEVPSAKNQHQWEFIVVHNRYLLSKLSDMSLHSKMLEDAPLAIVFLVNEEKIVSPNTWQQEMAASNNNVLLAAATLELGAVWLGVAPELEKIQFISDIFKLPKHIKAFSIVVIGYPADGQDSQWMNWFDSSKVKFNKY